MFLLSDSQERSLHQKLPFIRGRCQNLGKIGPFTSLNVKKGYLPLLWYTVSYILESRPSSEFDALYR